MFSCEYHPVLNKPVTGGVSVYMVDDQKSPVTKGLMSKFAKVFGKGLGQLNGKYKIRLDETVPPIQHAPRSGLSLVASSRRLSPATLTKIAGYYTHEMMTMKVWIPNKSYQQIHILDRQ